MKEDKSKEKIQFVLYGLLWILVLLMASTWGYQKSTNGSTDLFKVIASMEKFRFYYILNPITWWTCIKWSFIYWIFVALFIIYEQKFHHDAAGIEAGSAHWNDKVEEYNEEHNEPFGDKSYSDEPNRPHESEDDSWKEGLVNNNNPKPRKDDSLVPPVPGNPNMIESKHVRLSTADMKTHVNNNVFIVGGAGTGKSRFFIKPNVLQMNCSYVVTDPSGELLKSMHNVLAENGYSIKVFNLVDMTHSCKYNPFKYVRNETDVSILVDCFISNTTAPDQKSGDPFWDKSEKALLSSLMFYLVDIADEKFRKFSTILWMVQLAQMDENGGGKFGGPKKVSEFGFTLEMPLDELMDGSKKISTKTVKDKNGKEQEILTAVDVTDPEERNRLHDRISTSLCLTNYKTFKLGGTKTLKSILISAAVRLNPFSIPAIQNLTDDDNVELGEVGDKLTCFFAIIPQTNSTFNFLISMLFSQMFESLYFKGSTIPDSRLNYHVRFLLDEFANIGKIPEFPQKISTCRKYNISTTIVLQSIAQIKMLYKDDYETIIGNCDTAICLGTNEQTTADYFSKKLGKATITSRSKSTQVGKSGGSMSFQQTGRELMTPDEIMTIPFDECIVMMNHISPFYDKKYPLEEHPQFIYTGDYNKDNFYYLEKDDKFLCVDIAKPHNEEAMKEQLEDPKDEEYVPKNMMDLLEGLLLNDPSKDSYALIRDIDKNTQTNLYSNEKKKLYDRINECIEGKDGKTYKTVYYEEGNIEPIIVKPLIRRAMSQYEDLSDGIAIMYKKEDGSDNWKFVVAVKNEEDSNALKVFDKFCITYKNVFTGDKFKVFESTNNCDDDFLRKIKEGFEIGPINDDEEWLE